MSSLAGALDGYSTSTPYVAYKGADDIEMPGDNQSSSANDDPEDSQDQDEEMTDLFGNDNDVEELKAERVAASPTASGPDSERLPSPERERRQALEYEEEDVPQEIAVEVKEAEVSFPNLPVPRSSDGDNWVIRMPNFVKVDSKPFHPDTYIGPEQDDEETQHIDSTRERSMTIKLKVENMVRWRWTKDQNGVDQRQSNSRIIQWSDGSLSLRLGKELFDIKQDRDTSAGVARQYIGAASQQSQSSSQPPQSQSQPPAAKGLTYLVAQHKRSQVLQSEAVISGYMSLRPTGMQSETHRMLVRAVGQKHNKVARLRMAPEPTVDPEREKMELMKQSAKKSKKKSEQDEALGGGRKRRYSRRTAEHDVWSDDEEDIFPGSEEEEEDGAGRNSARKAKRKTPAEEKKGPEDYQEDDFVVADSSDEEAGAARKRAREGSEMEEDPLDRIDAKIKEQEDAKKRRRVSGEKGGTDDGDETDEAKVDAMDVESEEEEEEEFKVRRPGGTRKRAAINFDEEEEG